MFWEHFRCSGGVLDVLEVFWRCSGNTSGVLEVFWTSWRCSGNTPGVLEVFWMTPGAFEGSDTDTSALDWTHRSNAGQTRARRLNHPVMLGPDLAWVHT